MGRLATYAVLAVNAFCLLLTCFMIYADNWVINEKTNLVTENVEFTEGLWRCCLYKNDKERVCDYFDAWFFSGTFPGWIITGRMALIATVVIGLMSNLGFLLGSPVSNLYQNKPNLKQKNLLKRSSAFGMLICSGLSLLSALWVFFEVRAHYQDLGFFQNSGCSQAGVGSFKFITGSGVYLTFMNGLLWGGFGLVGLMCTHNKSYTEVQQGGPGSYWGGREEKKNEEMCQKKIVCFFSLLL